MEAALRTPEILDLIFQHLRFTEEPTVQDARSGPFLSRWRAQRTTLLNVGLTCKTFFEPAMANLWWRVTGFMPFIKLLPNITSKMSQNGYDYMTGREWTLEEELDESGLERFDFYAKLVTHIVDLGRKGDDNLNTLLIQLAEIRPSTRCFPRLKSLKVFYFNPDPWLFYTAPTLQELLILAQNYAEDGKFKTSLSTLIGRLPARSQDLQLLQIPFMPHERSLRSLLQLKDLRRLTIKSNAPGGPMTSEILGELSALPRLEVLDVSCPLGMASQAPLIPPLELSSDWYPRLTALAVTGSPITIHSVLLYLNSKPLEEVTLRLSWPEPREPSEASGGVAALTSNLQTFAESLKSVSISCEPFSPIYAINSLRSVPLGTEFITHLLALPRLEELHLASSLSVPTLTDGFLAYIPQSWPKLRKLSLPQTLLSSPIVQRAATLTFAAVQTMIHGLPDLKELSLEFSAGDTPLLDLTAPQLRVLDVRSSPIFNKRKTALNLAKAFPHLEKLAHSAPTETQNASARLFSDAWKEVATWLPVLTGKYSGEEDEIENLVVRPRGYGGEILTTQILPASIAYDEDDMEEDYDFDEEDDSDDPLGYGEGF